MRRKAHPVHTGGTQECRREAYRRSHHAAKIQVFLEAMLGLTPIEARRIPFGPLVAELKRIASGKADAAGAADYLRSYSKEED